jgi:hypothetical protein
MHTSNSFIGIEADCIEAARERFKAAPETQDLPTFRVQTKEHPEIVTHSGVGRAVRSDEEEDPGNHKEGALG